ncbi:MAG: GGDEF domain-containing protein [Rhodoferax sp.]|uniref:GGDEF domain-containing protein n=1 Tax=Rhodoferax sp. TaxID=50421 RepID=UPI00263237DA|nr:GGDEF domain-containing protein [Rhodoferax sp.]MDD5332723.1 GGDEF domain-containing protein [Rhodoferax sp.]
MSKFSVRSVMLRLTDLTRTLQRWQAEHASVVDAANSINLQRLGWLAPLVALVNAVHVLVLGGQLWMGQHAGLALAWRAGLLLAHLAMGLAMLGCAVALRYAGSSAWRVWLPAGTAGIGMLFAVVIVTIDQWVTPNVTPFLISCLLIGVVFYSRPLRSALLYLLAFVSYFYALSLTQGNPEQLFSNRLNGITACLLGWALTVLMWRHFTTITRQQWQLAEVNAALQDRQTELEHLSSRDGLTGLFNRHTFVALTEQELARARRHASATTLLLLDLDYFKRINDSHGHPAGDAVLRHVAALLRDTVRGTDLVGRLGGEEFIVLLPDTSAEAARVLAEKLRQRVAAQPLVWQELTIPTSVSIGLSAATPEHPASFEGLYSDADSALYEAKKRGRNQVV